METKERKPRAPGMYMHIKAIKEIKNEINNTVQKMNEYQEKLNEELKKSSEKAQVQTIRSQIKDLEIEIRSLLQERKTLFDEKEVVFNDYTAIKDSLSQEKRKISFSSLQELEKKEQEINYRLITEKVTAQQERDISNQLSEIKRKKIEMQSLGSKEGKLQALGTRLKEIKDAINDLKSKIQEKNASLDELNAQLKEINEKGKNKSPLVIDYENKINDLRALKDSLYERKKKEQEEIVKKEDLWKIQQEELKKLMEIENQRKAIKMKIKKLNEDRNNLISEQENFNPEKYDEIRIALSAIPKQKDIRLPLPLVQRLTSAGFDIPQSQEEIDALINKISCSKKDFLKISDENIRKIEVKISELDLKIEEEKKVLAEMPETDIKLKKEEMFAVN
ncbi:hypothetical protein TUBRATIS_29560 [Tubulinosema ratisbonensis]|uniref:Uncharacterized protein n=1 Tax=Tubulinosema ratisbonensis TaxID=291195 RepID=A0A437AHI3_9MICR|nr:hypothetical protein TUBRATIS_29560 [Tubulinosema ratisbonensis]